MKSGGQLSLRDRLGALLRGSRIAAGLELLMVPLLLVLQAAGVLRNPSLLLLIFGWLSLWVRRMGWRQVGLARPAHWPATVLAAIIIGVAYNALDIRVLLPLLHRLTGEPLELGQFNSMQGDLGALLLSLALIWPLAAFGEEMAYRGYALNRLADAFGRAAASWAVNAVLVGLAFGLAHRSEGFTGILDNVLAGLLFSALYLVWRRNLWLPILVHGVVDTSSIVLLYLGFQL
jgi:membrane protease YdiL (CAAX protease family)